MSEPMSDASLAAIRERADEARRGYVYVNHHYYGRDVPELLAEVERLREVRAQVWDEGKDEGADEAYFELRGSPSDPDAHTFPRTNPYRGGTA